MISWLFTYFYMHWCTLRFYCPYDGVPETRQQCHFAVGRYTERIRLMICLLLVDCCLPADDVHEHMFTCVCQSTSHTKGKLPDQEVSQRGLLAWLICSHTYDAWLTEMSDWGPLGPQAPVCVSRRLLITVEPVVCISVVGSMFICWQ